MRGCWVLGPFKWREHYILGCLGRTILFFIFVKALKWRLQGIDSHVLEGIPNHLGQTCQGAGSNWFCDLCRLIWDFLVAQLVKNPPAMWETWVRSLGWEDPLEKRMVTHSRILAWRNSWTVQSMESQRAEHDWATICPRTYRKSQEIGGVVQWTTLGWSMCVEPLPASTPQSLLQLGGVGGAFLLSKASWEGLWEDLRENDMCHSQLQRHSGLVCDPPLWNLKGFKKLLEVVLAAEEGTVQLYLCW